MGSHCLAVTGVTSQSVPGCHRGNFSNNLLLSKKKTSHQSLPDFHRGRISIAVFGLHRKHIKTMVVRDTKDEKTQPGTEEDYQDGEENQFSTEVFQLSRLKLLLPSVSVKENVSQLEVILEAIHYITILQA